MSIQALERSIGGLSSPSKMPGLAYGTPAKKCQVGSILRKVAGSVCAHCYARKGCYIFPVVARAQERRLAILLADLDGWRERMTELLRAKYRRKRGKRARVFRWHDSGDLQSASHLAALVRIARDLPTIRFWIPTKEYGIVREHVRAHGPFPANLVVRVSAPMIGQAPAPIAHTVASTVGRAEGFQCGAYRRGGKCGPCRACWDPAVPVVNYPVH